MSPCGADTVIPATKMRLWGGCAVESAANSEGSYNSDAVAERAGEPRRPVDRWARLRHEFGQRLRMKRNPTVMKLADL